MDAYVERSRRWPQEISTLRPVLTGCGLEERRRRLDEFGGHELEAALLCSTRPGGRVGEKDMHVMSAFYVSMYVLMQTERRQACFLGRGGAHAFITEAADDVADDAALCFLIGFGGRG